MKKKFCFKKKGFTLIELLAVIVILAIILLIAMPIVLNVISEAKKGAFESTARGLIKTVENEYMKNAINGSSEIITYTFEEGVQSVEPNTYPDLTFSGRGPANGYIRVYADGSSEMKITDGTWYVEKERENSDIASAVLYDDQSLEPGVVEVITFVKTFGGSDGFEWFTSVIQTNDGGYVTVGQSDSTDGDVEGLNKGDSDALIVKYDAGGNIEWNRNFGGSDREWLATVIQASDGGYVAVGHSASTDGDLEGLNKGFADAVIVKYDNSGNIEWNHNFGGSWEDQFYSVSQTSDGGYIAGGFSNSTDGDLTGLNKGGIDGIIVKYDASGNVEWNRNFGGTGVEYFEELSQTSDGGYIVFGWSPSTNGDLAGLNKGEIDGIIVKYDASGNIEWNRNFGGSSWDAFYSGIQTSDGGYIVFGDSESNDGDLAGLNKGDYDGIIVKYDVSGNVEWKYSYGGTDSESFFHGIQTSDGGYFATGYSASNDGDLAGLNKGIEDGVLVKFDMNGNVEWKRNFGGSSTDDFWGATQTSDGGYVVVGYSYSIDGDLEGLIGDEENGISVIAKYNSSGTLD